MVWASLFLDQVDRYATRCSFDGQSLFDKQHCAFRGSSRVEIHISNGMYLGGRCQWRRGLCKESPKETNNNNNENAFHQFTYAVVTKVFVPYV